MLCSRLNINTLILLCSISPPQCVSHFHIQLQLYFCSYLTYTCIYADIVLYNVQVPQLHSAGAFRNRSRSEPERSILYLPHMGWPLKKIGS